MFSLATQSHREQITSVLKSVKSRAREKERTYSQSALLQTEMGSACVPYYRQKWGHWVEIPRQQTRVQNKELSSSVRL